MRVVVVGAGLGGLCVAHGLHKAGVDVEVLEARDGIHDVGQGYRININAAGHNALRACLADGHFQAYEHTLHRQADPAVYLYSPVLQLPSRDDAPSAPGAIDRATVRRLLAGGLAGRVRFGRRVASIADIGAADLIVAADGAGSVLRQELVPHASPQPLGWSAIFGRSPLTAANRAWTAPVMLAGGTIADTAARYHAGMRTTAGAALKRSASYRWSAGAIPCLRPAHAAKPSPIPTGASARSESNNRVHEY
jgi:2-polyprenyl-6-methoxyphenol hydroxylase-like FAD-dependent oxidoreductase